MTCSICTHWNPRKSGDMAKQRMAIYDKGPRWTYYPPHHTCKAFKEAPADMVKKRAAWLEKRA